MLQIDTYSRSNVILFIVTPKSGELFTRDNLAAFAEMTEEAWQVPFTLRVDSIANFNSISAQGDDILVEPLYTLDQLANGAEPADIRARVLNEPDLINRLISPAGDVAGISIGLVVPDDTATAIPEIADAARQMARQWQDRWQQFEVGLTGGVIADKTFAEAGERDQRTLVPIMAALIVIALISFLRSVAATLAILAVIGATVVSAQGFAGWIGIVMNAATGSSPIAVMVLVLASAVHLVLTWLQKQRSGLSGEAAVEQAQHVGQLVAALEDHA